MLEISATLVSLRKKEHKTQQDVANYIGVSTAAVSKWETGQSYPDIMILPKLATYYNVSIDELLSYEPQLTKEHIQKIYVELAKDFQQQPFDIVLDKINAFIKEYYSCFPLLMQLAILLLNYSTIAQEHSTKTYALIDRLCIRIQKYSSDLKHIQLSHSIQAQIALMQNKPENVLTILGDQIEPYAGNDLLLGQAYLMLNNMPKAHETYQVSIYQKSLSTISLLTNYLQMQINNPPTFDATIQRCLGMIELFNLEKLHINSCLVFYITAAQCYIAQNNNVEAIQMLDRYRLVVEQLSLPIVLHGDEYFNKIDEWIMRELDLGQSAPRDNESIRQSLIDSVERHPAFIALHESPEFIRIVTSIRYSVGGK